MGTAYRPLPILPDFWLLAPWFAGFIPR